MAVVLNMELFTKRMKRGLSMLTIFNKLICWLGTVALIHLLGEMAEAQYYGYYSSFIRHCSNFVEVLLQHVLIAQMNKNERQKKMNLKAV